ncbi:hypothetical protein LCGC14_2759600 [marine sediment metagenome]|uniref:Uncharacterized protein n=1 Tax=marine sediment metagenome TaxID=412755 RepID=A0A0F8YZD2_9ZZZZ
MVRRMSELEASIEKLRAHVVLLTVALEQAATRFELLALGGAAANATVGAMEAHAVLKEIKDG